MNSAFIAFTRSFITSQEFLKVYKCVVQLSNFQTLQELLFHCLAELIRLIPTNTPALVFPNTKLKPFLSELLSLFSHELKANGVSKKKEVSSLKDLRVSTYFQG